MSSKTCSPTSSSTSSSPNSGEKRKIIMTDNEVSVKSEHISGNNSLSEHEISNENDVSNENLQTDQTSKKTENQVPNSNFDSNFASTGLNLLAAAISANAALSNNQNSYNFEDSSPPPRHSSEEKTTTTTPALPVKRRRLVANARERSRVHTISAAFEAVRQQIPAYTCNQKMSKLSILRIATSYIHALTVMVDQLDEEEDQVLQGKMNECTKVIQLESRTKSRKNK